MEIVMIPDAHGGAEHAVEVHSAGAAQFAARLRKVAKERRKWAKREGVLSYRIYDADLPEYALAVDWYQAQEGPQGVPQDAPQDKATGRASAKGRKAGGATLPQPGEACVHVAEYQAPKNVDEQLAAQRLQDALAVLPHALGVPEERVFCKVRKREKGGGQYAENRSSFAFWTGEPAHAKVGREDPYALQVDMNGYLDTGLFLDHRITRQLVGALAAGKSFLNLFAYTGTATVHAAGGGAATTTTVDLSQTYLDWAQRNMAANGFDGVRHEFARGDTLEWLSRAAALGRRWDLVFVDPPTFSNSKSMGTRTWDVQRDHVELLKAVALVMNPGGMAVFSNNLRSFRPDTPQLSRLGIRLDDISAKTIPADFERNPKIHRCYVLTRG